MKSYRTRFIFSSTQSVNDRIGELFSFTWASYAGLRELWWQARGFSSQFPELHIKEVEARFLAVPKIPGGVDLKKTILDKEWSSHEQEFAKSLVFGACTLYEGWAETVCKDIFNAPSADRHAKSIQFPMKSNLLQNTGYKLVVSAANLNSSAFMKSEIFPSISSVSSNCWLGVNEHLIAYRYFKEVRNSVIHSSGLATPSVIAAYNNLSSVQVSNPNIFRHKFQLPALAVDQPITLDIRDSVLFATVVRRLIHTFDAALSVSKEAEKIFLDRVKNTRASHPKWQCFPSDTAKYEAKLHSLLSASVVPVPVSIASTASYLRSKKLI